MASWFLTKKLGVPGTVEFMRSPAGFPDIGPSAGDDGRAPNARVAQDANI